MAHSGVKTHTESAEKRQAVDCSVVRRHYVVIHDYVESQGYIHRYAQMTCQAVARTCRKDSHRRIAPTQCTGGFIYSAVTATGKDTPVTLCRGFGRKCRGIPPSAGEPNIKVKSEFLQPPRNHFGHVLFISRARNGVYYQHRTLA